MLKKFNIEADFYLLGGYNYQNIFSIYYASFDANKKYPDFRDYKAPIPISLNPFEFDEITLNKIHTWSRGPESFPLVGDSFLYIKKYSNENVSFNLSWTHEGNFSLREEVFVASGEMQCQLLE